MLLQVTFSHQLQEHGKILLHWKKKIRSFTTLPNSSYCSFIICEHCRYWRRLEETEGCLLITYVSNAAAVKLVLSPGRETCIWNMTDWFNVFKGNNKSALNLLFNVLFDYLTFALNVRPSSKFPSLHECPVMLISYYVENYTTCISTKTLQWQKPSVA